MFPLPRRLADRGLTGSGRSPPARGGKEDVSRIGELALQIREGSKCSIGQTGMNPILHALQHFPQAFADAVAQGKKASAGRYRFAVTAPCASVCPSSLDIPAYVEEIGEQRFTDSLATIRESICMAGTLGRVCVRPCESNCRRANVDEAIAIKDLKRSAADYEIEKNRHPEIAGGKRRAGKWPSSAPAPPASPAPTIWR